MKQELVEKMRGLNPCERGFDAFCSYVDIAGIWLEHERPDQLCWLVYVTMYNSDPDRFVAMLNAMGGDVVPADVDTVEKLVAVSNTIFASAKHSHVINYPNGAINRRATHRAAAQWLCAIIKQTYAADEIAESLARLP